MAKPSAAEIDVELCAAPNGSYSLSLGWVKPLSPPPCRKRPDPLAPAGDDLVRIGLVANVPDELVAGRIEHIVKCDRQLDHAQPRAQVAARHRYGRDRLLRGARPQAAASCSLLRRPQVRPGTCTVSSSGVTGRSLIASGPYARRRRDVTRCVRVGLQSSPAAHSPHVPRTSITGR